MAWGWLRPWALGPVALSSPQPGAPVGFGLWRGAGGRPCALSGRWRLFLPAVGARRLRPVAWCWVARRPPGRWRLFPSPQPGRPLAAAGGDLPGRQGAPEPARRPVGRARNADSGRGVPAAAVHPPAGPPAADGLRCAGGGAGILAPVGPCPGSRPASAIPPPTSTPAPQRTCKGIEFALAIARDETAFSAEVRRFGSLAQAPTAAGPDDSRVRTWHRLHVAAFGSAPVLPLTTQSVISISSLLSAAGYRTAPAYVSAMKRRHIAAHHPWGDDLAQAARDAARAALRGLGPRRQALGWTIARFLVNSLRGFLTQFWASFGPVLTEAARDSLVSFSWRPVTVLSVFLGGIQQDLWSVGGRGGRREREGRGRGRVQLQFGQRCHSKARLFGSMGCRVGCLEIIFRRRCCCTEHNRSWQRTRQRNRSPVTAKRAD